ncbi:2-amino-3-ketobutyrate coenzyme A ligase [Streptomyces fumanus]
MDGYVAPLREICDLADRYDAMVMVDDSHAVGFVGPGGRGTPELHGVMDRVDILTGTLGKALGGASGGYVAARAEIVALLRQRSRPYLFSNTLAPVIAAASLKVLDLLESADDLRVRLAENTALFRRRMTEEGFDVLPGDHAIAPVMIGDAARAGRLAELLLAAGLGTDPVPVPRPRGHAVRAGGGAAMTVTRLNATELPHYVEGLADLLTDTVHGGASIGFLAPLERAEALAWWRRRADAVAAGALAVWVAHQDGRVTGTVSLALPDKPNSRHRAELVKLMVHREARGRGLGRTLLTTAEEAAAASGITLLHLDTETDSPAEHLYRSAGWTRAGVIPDYAASPDGVLRPTTLYFKRIGGDGSPPVATAGAVA